MSGLNQAAWTIWSALSRLDGSNSSISLNRLMMPPPLRSPQI